MKDKMTRGRKLKGLFSVVLVLAMVFTLMPLSPRKVHAEDVKDYRLVLKDDGFAYQNSTKMATMPEGLSYANGEWTMENFHFTGKHYSCAVEIAGVNVLNLKGENTIRSEYESGPVALYLQSGAQITIRGTGSLECTTKDASGTAYGINARYGTLIIESGTITAKTGNLSSGTAYGIRYTNMTIDGGTVNFEGGNASASASYGAYSDDTGVLNINGGTVYATGNNGQNSWGLYTSYYEVNITGGELIATSGPASGFVASTSGGMTCFKISMTGGSIIATGGDGEVDSYGFRTDGSDGFTISNGNFVATGKNKAVKAGTNKIVVPDNYAFLVGADEDSTNYLTNITDWGKKLNNVEYKYVKLVTKHVIGTKHDAVAGTCSTPGTIEWYECTESSCNRKHDALGNELTSVEGSLDPANHTYGTTGASRYTCTGCGHVDTDKRDAADTADTNAANAVIDKIDAIGTVALTDASKAKIDAARSAYDALTTDQKAKITAAEYKKLTDAEAKYKELANAGKYEGVETSSGHVKDITGTEDAPKETNHYSASIKNSSELETLLDVAAADKAQGVNVWIELVEAKDTMPAADKALIEKAAGTKTVGVFLDASLFKKVGDNDAEKVHELKGKIKVSLVVPENIRKTGRTYGIVRVHGGVATPIEGTFDAATHTFTFETDRFSSYALTYEDPASEESGEVAPPKTGDVNMAWVYMLMLLGTAWIGVACYRIKRN